MSLIDIRHSSRSDGTLTLKFLSMVAVASFSSIRFGNLSYIHPSRLLIVPPIKNNLHTLVHDVFSMHIAKSDIRVTISLSIVYIWAFKLISLNMSSKLSS